MAANTEEVKFENVRKAGYLKSDLQDTSQKNNEPIFAKATCLFGRVEGFVRRRSARAGRFIECDEVTDRHGKPDIVVGVKRIETESVFQSRDDDRKTKRIQTRILQWQFVHQRGERLSVFLRYALASR